jgi:hypothetical protein
MSSSISTLLTRNLHDVFGENDPARRRGFRSILRAGTVSPPPLARLAQDEELDRAGDNLSVVHLKRLAFFDAPFGQAPAHADRDRLSGPRPLARRVVLELEPRHHLPVGGARGATTRSVGLLIDTVDRLTSRQRKRIPNRRGHNTRPSSACRRWLALARYTSTCDFTTDTPRVRCQDQRAGGDHCSGAACAGRPAVGADALHNNAFEKK